MHKKEAGKLQTGNTFPKQYWLAVNGKPTTTRFEQFLYIEKRVISKNKKKEIPTTIGRFK